MPKCILSANEKFGRFYFYRRPSKGSSRKNQHCTNVKRPAKLGTVFPNRLHSFSVDKLHSTGNGLQENAKQRPSAENSQPVGMSSFPMYGMQSGDNIECAEYVEKTEPDYSADGNGARESAQYGRPERTSPEPNFTHVTGNLKARDALTQFGAFVSPTVPGLERFVALQIAPLDPSMNRGTQFVPLPLSWKRASCRDTSTRDGRYNIQFLAQAGSLSAGVVVPEIEDAYQESLQVAEENPRNSGRASENHADQLPSAVIFKVPTRDPVQGKELCRQVGPSKATGSVLERESSSGKEPEISSAALPRPRRGRPKKSKGKRAGGGGRWSIC